MANSFGKIIKMHLFGGSHEQLVGVILEGIPSGININVKDFTEYIDRRKGGTTATTDRVENDIPKIVTGLFNDVTTGLPITILFDNKHKDSKNYDLFKSWHRPGHADFTQSIKYGKDADIRGGGIASGRMTLPIMIAGLIAAKCIPTIIAKAYISHIHGEIPEKLNWQKIKDEGDSLGGEIICEIINVPAGLGEPFFDSVESYLSHLLFSIPGIKAIGFGESWQTPLMTGSEYNDIFISENGQTVTNHCGGIQGGITNGNSIIYNIAVRPPASISKPQKSLNFLNKKMEIHQIKGSHDTAFILRLPPVIEAISLFAIADLYLFSKIYKDKLL
ncbi:MAG: chorismate synthase [Bacteroidales bacterium]|nr:chorismate synthase [Bacteroidales bacterium]MDI3479484.1 chorismate synthase [Rikenellaceae bacterium]MDN5356302.1 chorismate synthase [Rikenellaceae bacterium]